MPNWMPALILSCNLLANFFMILAYWSPYETWLGPSPVQIGRTSLPGPVRIGRTSLPIPASPAARAGPRSVIGKRWRRTEQSSLPPSHAAAFPAGRRSRPSRSRTRKSRPTPSRTRKSRATPATASPPPWASRARAGPTRRFFPPPSLLLPLPVPTVRSLPPRASPPPVQIGRALPLGWRGAAHASAHTTRRTTGRRRCQGEREPRGRPMLPGSR
jgi:hypothetical protein